MNIKSLGLTELSQSEQRKVNGGILPAVIIGILAVAALLTADSEIEDNDSNKKD